MKPFYLIPLISMLALAGCAHKQPQPPKTQEYFFTLIKPDGTKQFSYTLTTEMPGDKDSGDHGPGGGGSGGHGGHGGRGGHGGGQHGDHKGKTHDAKDDSMQDQFTLIFNDAMNTKLNTTGFCRTGFNQLDTQSRRGAMFVKGECNETANDTDRANFPNPPPKKIKVDVLE